MRLRNVEWTEGEGYWHPGYYGETRRVVATVPGYGEVTLEQSAGSNDRLYVYRDLDDPGALYVVCHGRVLSYVGVDRYDLNETNATERAPDGALRCARDLFCQDSQDREHIFGRDDCTDLHPCTIIRRAAPYLEDY